MAVKRDAMLAADAGAADASASCVVC